MNLQALVGIVRAVGLCCAITLVGCDSGGEKKDAPKAEEKKVEAKVEEKKAAPEEKKADPVDAKAADPAPTGDAKAPADPPAGDAKAPAGDAKAGDAKAPAGDAKAAAPAIDGKPLYDSKCKVCHAADGKGTEAMKKNKIPDMTVADWQTKHDKASVVKAITDGVDGTKMKSFKEKLKPEEIEAVAVYVKGMK